MLSFFFFFFKLGKLNRYIFQFRPKNFFGAQALLLQGYRKLKMADDAFFANEEKNLIKFQASATRVNQAGICFIIKLKMVQFWECGPFVELGWLRQ